ncbi:endopolygalacturonase [Pseudanabaena yagii GIHE-NHR1]|uniref:Endopolygalacturonase n=2 Tax=Pseudanabaena TaxID=1152 RepID=A0ABX1M0T4_9CYAN|nr:endopolygalacturonase [Pseudanabaena yagii GIHE-NHR1]
MVMQDFFLLIVLSAVPVITTGCSSILNIRSASAENITFPDDAGVINVKSKYGAKGDGVTDDTNAIQTALNAYPNGKRIIYLPNGTYLVSKTLNWASGTAGTGNDYKNIILQGQSEKGVIIKLKDRATGFTDPNTPKAVIFTGPAPAQRFGNSIRNLTVDIGAGNLGASGIQFNASNQGTMRYVTIQSRDGRGVIGLDMDFADEIGPLLIKGLTVKGFQYGIMTSSTVNSQTFEDIHLENQSVYGFLNYGQVINIRNLTSYNAVPVINNKLGQMTIIDSSLNGVGKASSQPAIGNGDRMLARNINTSGYRVAIESGKNGVNAPKVSEFVTGSVVRLSDSPLKTLNLPIKETPDVPWDDPVQTPWANVVTYGAIPNDGKDDTSAIQAAIDSGKTTVYFPAGGTFEIQGTVLIRNNVRRILGTEGRVRAISKDAKLKVVDGTSQVVVIERIANGYDFPLTVDNASSRTVVLKNLLDIRGDMTGPGDVFIEDVGGGNWQFGKQNIWARQFNVENAGTHITNNGGNLWIFGLKTERGGTLIDTKNTGRTELLGGLAYTTTPAPDGTQIYPMFINNESSISITLGEINYGNGFNYTTYVREIKGRITRNLLDRSLPNYSGSGKHIPLYVGY